MPFTQTDFENIEIRTKLITIMNDIMGIPPLTKISTLTKRQQLNVNIKMNEYVRKLPVEGYLEKIDKDFNFVMEDVFEKMKIEELFIPLVNSDVVLLEKIAVE
tara:strand:+ start:183 stop:491 length:309 start_codon:yes stop_codon:yes gene_type:complete